ncbi:hypothetical protein [Nonomuraea sp. NPDC002799]
MFKRRLVALGAAAVLAITGLAGSALADETPSPKPTCTTADGKPIELSKALPPKRGAVIVSPDGKVTRVEPGSKQDGMKIEKLPDGELPDAAALAVPFEEGIPLPDGVPLDAPHAEPGQELRKVEAGVAAPDGPAKTIKIVCKKPE